MNNTIIPDLEKMTGQTKHIPKGQGTMQIKRLKTSGLNKTYKHLLD